MDKSGQDSGKEKNADAVKIVDKDFKVSGFGVRHQQCIIMFVCLSIGYSMRACIGVALVGMVNPNYNNVTEANVTANATEESGGVLQALLLTNPYPVFNWNKRVQDIIISSFFWGYMALQIPSGQLVHMFGPRRLMTGALAINCFVSFFFPYLAYYGGWVFAAIGRLMQGLSQACLIPGMYGFFGQWTPLEERSRLVGFAMGGQAIGTVLGLPVTGFLAASPLGWPGIFRFYGILSGLATFMIYFMVTDTPAQHPRISMAERRYIEEALGQKNGAEKKRLPIPWKDIFRCRSLYGIMFAHIANTWGQVTLFTEIPAFMDKVMGVNIKSNGLLTALPFLVMWFTNFFFSWMTDKIIVKKWLSVTNARKLANTVGSVPAALGLVILAYAPKQLFVVEIILIFICAFKIATHVGFMVTHIDITPNFAGTMLSLTNFMSNLVGSQAPLVAGFMLNDVTSEYEWRKVFFVAAALYFITNIAYVVLATAEKAPWNDPQDDDLEKSAELQPMVGKDNGVKKIDDE